MTKSQLSKLLDESNVIYEYTKHFSYYQIIAHYHYDKNMTTLYAVCYEDHGSGYEPKLIEPLVEFQGRRIMTFESLERIEDDEDFSR